MFSWQPGIYMLSLGFGRQTKSLLAECLDDRVGEEHESDFFFTNLNGATNTRKGKFLYFETADSPSVLMENFLLESTNYFDCRPPSGTVAAIPATKFSWDPFQVNRINTGCNDCKTFWDGWNQSRKFEHEDVYYKMFEKYDSLRLFSTLFGETFDSGFGLGSLQEFIREEYPKSEVYSFLSDDRSCDYNSALRLAYCGMNSTVTLMNDSEYWKKTVFPSLCDPTKPQQFQNCSYSVVETMENSSRPATASTLNAHYAQIQPYRNSGYIGTALQTLKVSEEQDELLNTAISWYENQLSLLDEAHLK